MIKAQYQRVDLFLTIPSSLFCIYDGKKMIEILEADQGEDHRQDDEYTDDAHNNLLGSLLAFPVCHNTPI